MNGAPLLQVRVSIDYGRTRVLAGAALDILPGEIVGLVGSSGSGKSSLALAILRLLHFKGGAASGEIRFDGRDLLPASEGDMRQLRGREIAFVPQSPGSYLNPMLRIGDQLSEAWRAHGGGRRAEVERRIAGAMEQVGLPATRVFLRRYPGEVSVGQAQRVLIAMAVLHRPRLLIADEPTSSLDAVTQGEILRLFSRLSRELEMAILYVSHDLVSVAGFCRRVAILHGGAVVEFAPTSEVFSEPRHPYTRELIGAIRPLLPQRPGPALARFSQSAPVMGALALQAGEKE